MVHEFAFFLLCLVAFVVNLAVGVFIFGQHPFFAEIEL